MNRTLTLPKTDLTEQLTFAVVRLMFDLLSQMKSDFDVPRIQRIQCTNEAPSTWQIDYIASGILGVYQNPIKGIDKNSAPGKEAGTLTIVIGDVSKATLS